MSEIINVFAVAGLRVPAKDGINIEKFILEKGFVTKMHKLGIGYLILGFSGLPTELAMMSLGLKANGVKDLAKPGDRFIYFYAKTDSGKEQAGESLLVFAGELKTAMDEHLGVGKREVALSDKLSG